MKRKYVGLLLGVGVGIYFLRPPCLFHTLTGLECPGCGATRMVDALLQGDWATAWQCNPFLLLVSPVLLLTLWDTQRSPQRSRMHDGIFALLCVGAIGYGIWRNVTP